MYGAKTARRGGPALIAAFALAACGMLGSLLPKPPHPAEAPPPVTDDGYELWRQAIDQDGRRIVISLRDRRLWLLEGADTLLSAPVAIGRGKTFSYQGKTFRFHTPRGKRRIVEKATDPVWVPPEWHYLEKASYRKLDIVRVERGKKYDLDDGTYIEIRGDQVGRVNKYGNFWPFTPGMEIIFYGTIYVPPIDTDQRRIPDALGPYKLDMGDGYLIHGTHRYNRDSIGRAASHGCVRMRNDDLERLYRMVEVGTPVYIY